MDKSIDYITEEKKISLEKELEESRGPKRREIIDILEYAKSLGDLSENAEYHNAREEQGKLEARIKEIEKILQSAVVVKGGGGDIVSIGSKVVVIKEGTDKEITYNIVGSEEASMAEGKISNRSPFGSALFGKKKGDTVIFETPKGSVKYQITKVS